MFSSTILKLRIWQVNKNISSIADTFINLINMILD